MTSVVPAGQIAFGIQLPVQSQSRLYVAEWELSAGVDEIVAAARAAEQAGFFYVGVCDHVAIPADLAPRMGTVWYDTIATLGLLAGVTERVRLLSHVYVLPYRHPLLAAKAFATLDALSHGRVIVGVGAGHVEGEFAALGADHALRGATLDRAIDTLSAALSADFVDGVAVAPRPVQRPRPPIWVGGSSRPALRRAAERGDGWLPQGTPFKQMAASIAYLRDQRAAVGRDEAIDIGATAGSFYVGEAGWDLPPGTFAGKPVDVAGRLQAWVDVGANQLQVRMAARTCAELEDQLGAFGAEVIPLVTP